MSVDVENFVNSLENFFNFSLFFFDGEWNIEKSNVEKISDVFND